MAAALEAPASAPEGVAVVSRKLWTRKEYRQLTEAGYLEDGKVELINGEIWEKMRQGRRHTVVVMRLIKLFGQIFGIDRLQSQSSLNTGELNNPEPDLAVLAREIEQYLADDPLSAETLLIAEASNTTLRTDLTVKQKMYAQSGIPEYWVVDIPNRLLHVFREPTADGYASETIPTTADEVRPLAAPDAIVHVAELLP